MGDENYLFDKCVGVRKESLIYNILIDVFMRCHGSYIIENGSSPTGGPKRKEKYKKKKYENFVDLNYDQFQLKANIEASQWNPTHNFCSC